MTLKLTSFLTEANWEQGSLDNFASSNRMWIIDTLMSSFVIWGLMSSIVPDKTGIGKMHSQEEKRESHIEESWWTLWILQLLKNFTLKQNKKSLYYIEIKLYFLNMFKHIFFNKDLHHGADLRFYHFMGNWTNYLLLHSPKLFKIK